MSSYMKAGYTPPKPPKPPKKKKTSNGQRMPTKGKKAMKSQANQPPKPPKIKRPLSMRILICLACILAIAALGCLAFVLVAYHELSAYENQFYPGIYIGDIHIGGLTSEQAVTLIQSQVDERLSGYSINLVDEKGQRVQTLTAQDVSLHYDLQKQLSEAWNVGREGNLIERLGAIKEILQEPCVFEWAFAYDNAQLQSFVKDIASQIDCEPKDAQSIYAPASAAPFSFSWEQNGALLDQEDLRVQLQTRLDALDTNDVELQIETLLPAVTHNELEENISLRALVYSDIPTDSDENRKQNIRAALERINGLIIAPGEVFDFNALVGKRTSENGFVQAEEIAYGEGVSGIGGGVCQVSTALYQAVLCADLDVVERHPHVIPSNYAPAGQEATVSDQGLNFIFRNSTTYPIYIKARYVEANDGQIEITLFGAALDMFYALESSITEVLPIPEAIRVRDKEQAYVIYTDEEMQIVDGREGYIAQTYRISLQNGEEIGRTLVTTDTYQAVAPQIYVGTTSRDVGE